MKKINGIILKNEEVAPDLYEMELEAADIVAQLEPGHFLQLDVRQ